MELAPVHSYTEFWKRKFCNFTPGFPKYLSPNILKTVNHWGKVFLSKMIGIEWTIDWYYLKFVDLQFLVTVDNDKRCHETWGISRDDPRTKNVLLSIFDIQ